MDTRQIDQLTVKKYFRQILDRNVPSLSAEIQQRRLAELDRRITNKMDSVEQEIVKLSTLITQFKSLERTVKSNPTPPARSKTTIEDLANRQLEQEIIRLEKMYALLAKKASANPRLLDRLSEKIDTKKKKIPTTKHQIKRK